MSNIRRRSQKNRKAQINKTQMDGTRKRRRVRQPLRQYTAAVSGQRIQRQLTAFRKVRTAQQMARRQRTGAGAVHFFQRTIYSNYNLATGDPNQNIYIQSGTSPFRIYNTGTGNYQNADSYAIEFQGGSMVIKWYNGTTLQTTYAYNIPSFTELTALFDQMQIDWIELEWFYGTQSSQTVGVTSSGVAPLGPTGEIYGQPLHIYVKDYDDSNALGANPISVVSQYEAQKSWQMSPGFNDARHVVRIKPKMDMSMTDGSGTSTGVAQAPRNVWLDATSGTSVPHYGLKGCVNLISTVQNTTPANTYILGTLGFRCTYHFKFKNVR